MTSNVSRWRRWWLRPQFRDEPQNLLEHLPCDGDLGHLEDNIAAVAHHLRADLDQLVLQTRQRPVLDRLRRHPPSPNPSEIGFFTADYLRSIDTDASPGSQNAGLVESVLGGVEGPTRLRWGGQGVDVAAVESGAASVGRCYLRVCGKALASDRRILFRSSQLPLWHGLSAPIAPKALDLPATAEPQPQIRHLGRRPADP